MTNAHHYYSMAVCSQLLAVQAWQSGRIADAQTASTMAACAWMLFAQAMAASLPYVASPESAHATRAVSYREGLRIPTKRLTADDKARALAQKWGTNARTRGAS